MHIQKKYSQATVSGSQFPISPFLQYGSVFKATTPFQATLSTEEKLFKLMCLLGTIHIWTKTKIKLPSPVSSPLWLEGEEGVWHCFVICLGSDRVCVRDPLPKGNRINLFRSLRSQLSASWSSTDVKQQSGFWKLIVFKVLFARDLVPDMFVDLGRRCGVCAKMRLWPPIVIQVGGPK